MSILNSNINIPDIPILESFGFHIIGEDREYVSLVWSGGYLGIFIRFIKHLNQYNYHVFGNPIQKIQNHQSNQIKDILEFQKQVIQKYHEYIIR